MSVVLCNIVVYLNKPLGFGFIFASHTSYNFCLSVFKVSYVNLLTPKTISKAQVMRIKKLLILS